MLYDARSSTLVLRDNLEWWKEWEVEGKLKREGIYIYLGPIHVDMWQKPTRYCRAIILQLKISKFKKMANHPSRRVLDSFK